jgi:Fur family transcriptional regulator, ferric uptake regulator
VPSSLADQLRARGLRLTAQRQLVLEAVYRLGHATPDQIHAEVSRTAAGVNITTIYRTLELLEELDLVTHAHLSHGAPTYHGVGDAQHVHLVCSACGQVAEMATDWLRPLVAAIKDDRGFVVDLGHVALFGLCTGCAAGRGHAATVVTGQEAAGHEHAGHAAAGHATAGQDGGAR